MAHSTYIFYRSLEKTSRKRNSEFRPLRRAGATRTYPARFLPFPKQHFVAADTYHAGQQRRYAGFYVAKIPAKNLIDARKFPESHIGESIPIGRDEMTQPERADYYSTTLIAIKNSNQRKISKVGATFWLTCC